MLGFFRFWIKKETALEYKIHWHVLLTHFPISLFGVAFIFQILHLVVFPECFELATNVVIVMGAVSMIPAIWSGWRTWKRNYKGAKVVLFQRKIVIAFILLGISMPLAIWRVGFLGLHQTVTNSTAHWFYLVCNVLLLIGAAAEGLYGGLLNHH